MDELARRAMMVDWLVGETAVSAVFSPGVSLADDVKLVDKARQTQVTGAMAVMEVWDAFWQRGLANRELDFQEVYVENEVVFVKGWVNGRQAHSFWGLPCTGRDIRLQMTLIFTTQHAQISQIELRYDAGSLLRQLGLGL